jgi:hypothetical protein
MGEGKRRKRAGEAGPRLPDFVFGRDKVAEQAGGFILAGRMVTNILKGKKPDEEDQVFTHHVINSLVDTVRRDPHMQEAGAWRHSKPPGGLSPLFPDAAMIEETERCAVIEVRIDPRGDGTIRLDDGLLAQIMGGIDD